MENKIDYLSILDKKFKDKEWSINGFRYEDIQWFSDTPKPTKKEMDALWDEVMKEVKSDRESTITEQDLILSKLESVGLDLDEIVRVFQL